MAQDKIKMNTLSEQELERVRAAVLEHLQAHESIPNSTLRSLTGIDSDQAIFFFNTMLKRQVLKKLGTTAGTRYVRAER